MQKVARHPPSIYIRKSLWATAADEACHPNHFPIKSIVSIFASDLQNRTRLEIACDNFSITRLCLWREENLR